MNGQTILILGACVGVLLHRVVRGLSEYDAESGRHIVRRDLSRSLRRAGRLLLAACKDDSVVYDWFLGPRQRQRFPVWPMPITMCGGPMHGRVLRLALRTGDVLHFPMPRPIGRELNSYGGVTASHFRKAKYRITRDLRKAFFTGITE